MRKATWLAGMAGLTAALGLARPVLAQGKTQVHDSAFHALQMRGKLIMGVDQYTSTHRFEELADGGRIELQRDVDDAVGIAAIRSHLKTIVQAFQKGDFAAPALVHMKQVPGTSVMAARKGAISYVFRELPRGGEVRIKTQDAQALAALREFLAFQRSEH